MALSSDDAPAPDHRQRLGLLLARIGRSSWDSFERVLAPFDLRPRHVVVLMEVRGAGGLTQRALQEALGFDPAVLVGLLNTLEGRGLVTRSRDPADRRRHIVELTTAGRRQLERADDALARAEATLLKALSARERHQLATTLAKLDAALGAPDDD